MGATFMKFGRAPATTKTGFMVRFGPGGVEADEYTCARALRRYRGRPEVPKGLPLSRSVTAAVTSPPDMIEPGQFLTPAVLTLGLRDAIDNPAGAWAGTCADLLHGVCGHTISAD